ncbi:MAG: hypothetical protein MZV63_42765 [Marinilabiliales bacterium]|nr:hypothetical protein [Marinilabiliales bacterium]
MTLTLIPSPGSLINGPYASGYGMTSSEVLVPAFLAAYTKRDAEQDIPRSFPLMRFI